MSLARYTNVAEVIMTEMQAGQRGERMTTQPCPDTLDKIGRLLRAGATRGIYPQWMLRKAPGVTFDQDQLNEIASQIEEGYVAGEAPLDWRVDVYA